MGVPPCYMARVVMIKKWREKSAVFSFFVKKAMDGISAFSEARGSDYEMRFQYPNV